MAEKKITLETTVGELIPAGKYCFSFNVGRCPMVCVDTPFGHFYCTRNMTNNKNAQVNLNDEDVNGHNTAIKDAACPRPAEAV